MAMEFGCRPSICHSCVDHVPLKGPVDCDIMEVDGARFSVVTQPIKDNLMLFSRSNDRLGSNTDPRGCEAT